MTTPGGEVGRKDERCWVTGRSSGSFRKRGGCLRRSSGNSGRWDGSLRRRRGAPRRSDRSLRIPPGS